MYKSCLNTRNVYFYVFRFGINKFSNLAEVMNECTLQNFSKDKVAGYKT